MNDEQQSVLTLKLRVTPELKQRIVESAAKYNRSMNADMVARLQESFDSETTNSVSADAIVNALIDRFGDMGLSNLLQAAQKKTEK